MALRYPDDVPVLTDGDSVVLRAHSREDVDAITQQCADPDMLRYTTVPRPYRTADAHEFLDHVRTDWQQHTPTSARAWAITVGPSGREQFAGSIDYRPTGHATATVGYGLHPAHRGHGLMSVALGLVLAWAFDHDGQELITWTAVVGNWASAKTVWRHGFRLEGQVRGLCVQPDGAFDGWIATLRRDDPRTPTQPWPWRLDPRL